MIEIRFIDLSKRGITPPAASVHIVLAQPYLAKGGFTPNEPYKLTGTAKLRQVGVVERTLDVASKGTGAGSKLPTQFTVFPEYCIPGLEGVEVVERRLQSDDWANGTVVIGGVDGLTKPEYEEVLKGGSTHHDQLLNGIAMVADDEWVNCAITWVKHGDGNLSRWVQPKISPAWAEASGECQRMFRGGSVYLFRGQRSNGEQFIFGTMICFDWIAATTPRLYERILEETHKKAKGAQLPLTWLFVIEHNEKPSHFDVLNNVVGFFRDRTHPNATRASTSIVFVNTAGSERPGYCGAYGSTSLILGPSTSFMTQPARPTVSHEGYRYREQNWEILKSAQCRDVYFRERGECIHTFDQTNPSMVQHGAAGRSYAVDNAEVHAAGDDEYLLAPGTGVPAVVKWANDLLDQTSKELPHHRCGVTKDLREVHDFVVEALRKAASNEMAEVVKLATPPARADEMQSPVNPEDWGDEEARGLRHVLKTLGIVGAGGKLVSVGKEMTHGVVCFAGGRVDVAAIQGVSHQACIEHLGRRLKRQRSQLLLVSKDVENTPWSPKHGSFLKAKSGGSDGAPRFTDPVSPTYHLGYQDLLGMLGAARDLDEIERGIKANAGA